MELEVKYARVVHLNSNSNSENEAYTELVETGFRPCLVKGDVAIDVENYQLYRIIDGYDLNGLEPEVPYVDRLFDPSIDNCPILLESLHKASSEADVWYESVIRKYDEDKIIDFQKAKRKYEQL